MADDRTDELRRQLARRLEQVLRQRVALRAPALPEALLSDDQDGPLPVLTDEELEAAIEPYDPAVEPTVPGFDLRAEVGRGGQGVVYRATERSTGRDVAVKVLPGGHFADPRARSRFAREVRILSRLASPNVVGVVSHGRTADGSPFLVMPYVFGPPLDEYAAELRDDGAVALVFAQLADALDGVHRSGVVHRDLKPANVRVDRSGTVQILDFGLAHTSAWADKSRVLTRSGHVVGSLPWLSPEQAAGRSNQVDGRTDIHAVGLMLCRAIARGGQPPYRVTGPFDQVIRRICQAQRQVAGRHRTDPLAQVTLRCLAIQRRHRYPTAAALATDLRRAATGAPVRVGRRAQGPR